MAIINLVVMIDPQSVVLGGDLCARPHAEELFVRPIELLIRLHSGAAPRLRLSQLQGDAALFGAVQAAIATVFSGAGRSTFNSEAILSALADAAHPSI